MNKRFVILLFLTLAVFLSGCNMTTVDKLYSPPLRSDDYTNLQAVMQKAMSGCEYAAPQSGENQQTVQLADLDGDGKKEYLLFAKNSNAEKPLRIFVFSGDGETYHLQDTIEFAGAAFDKVDYVQMDRSRGVELVVGCQVSDQILRAVSAYTMTDGKMQRILTTHYSGYLCTDMDLNGLSDVFVFYPDPETAEKSVAECFGFWNGTLNRSQPARLSASVEQIRRIVVGKLQDGPAAVYIASSFADGSVITDAVSFVDGHLLNVCLTSDSENAVQTVRNSLVYADDIDNDGVLELPSLVSPAAAEGVVSDGSQYVIRWYSFNSDGSTVDKLHTYHNFVGKWYLQIDSAIAKQLIVTQKGNSYEFGIYQPNQAPLKLMTLTVLTGQKREEQAVQDNRFAVFKNESTIYAVKLEVASASFGITQESILSGFHLIVQDWNTGMT